MKYRPPAKQGGSESRSSEEIGRGSETGRSIQDVAFPRLSPEDRGGRGTPWPYHHGHETLIQVIKKEQEDKGYDGRGTSFL